ESAVFLCCLESVNNAVKHAPGAPVTVRIAEAGGTLRFTITDSGPGFVPPAGADQSSGRGLRNVRRRITDVGGWLSLNSEPGRGTTIDGVVPVPPHEDDTERLPPGFAGRRTPPQPGRTLVAEARSLIAAVRVGVDPAVVLELVAVESALHDPLRVGFLGPPGADMTVLMRAVLPAGPTPDVEPF